MPITLTQLLDHAHLILGEQHDPRLDPTEVVNEAGRYLVSMRPWKFLERPRVLLDLTGPLSLTDATWSESARTLTLAGAFAGYSYNAGDRLQITGGTGATAGDYAIASRVSDDAITLATSIGSGADGQSDITGAIAFPYVNLPADFGLLIDIESTNNHTRQVTLTSLGHLETLRGDIVEATLDYFVALEFPTQTSASAAPPQARLSIYPPPASDAAGALSLVYRAGWVELSNPSQVANIPPQFDALLVELVRAFAQARGGISDKTLVDLLEPIERSALMDRLKRHDGAVQPRIGPLRHGCVRPMWGGHPVRRYHDTITLT